MKTQKCRNANFNRKQKKNNFFKKLCDVRNSKSRQTWIECTPITNNFMQNKMHLMYHTLGEPRWKKVILRDPLEEEENKINNECSINFSRLVYFSHVFNFSRIKMEFWYS